MAAMTIVDTPFVTLWYYPDKKIIHHQIHKFISGKEFRDFLLAGSDVLTRNRAQKWLSDDRGSTVLMNEDVEWSHRNWFPQTAQGGWRYWAIVKPDKVMAQLAMERLVQEYGKYGITARFFTRVDDAMNWLESQ